MNKLIPAGIILALVIGIVGLFSGGDVIEKIERKYINEGKGAVAGPVIPGDIEVAGMLTKGGGYYATSSTASTYTLTGDEFSYGYVKWTPNVDTTLTTSATSSFVGIRNPGDSRTVYLQNASSTAASTITLAAGSGFDVQYTEATGGDLVLNGLDWAEITFIRQSNTDITMLIDEFTEAD